MGFQGILERSSTCPYKRLINADEEMERPRRRCLRRIKSRLRGLRLSKSRRLTFRMFSLIALQSRIARIYGDILKRIKVDDLCPTIIMSSHWGLPVLSHSSVKCRMNVISQRKADMLSVRAF